MKLSKPAIPEAVNDKQQSTKPQINKAKTLDKANHKTIPISTKNSAFANMLKAALDVKS